MRKTIYYCDACHKEFGNEEHLNIKNGQVFISYMNTLGNWSQRKLKMTCSEYHFCGSECLKIWLDGIIKASEVKYDPKFEKPMGDF